MNISPARYILKNNSSPSHFRRRSGDYRYSKTLTLFKSWLLRLVTLFGLLVMASPLLSMVGAFVLPFPPTGGMS